MAGRDLNGRKHVGGIDPSLFKNRYDFERPNGAGFSCPICKQVLRDAVEMKCGCRFCNGCISDYVCDQIGQVQCPSPKCKNVFEHGLIQPHFPSRSAVNDAVVFCENVEFGCQAEMKYGDLSHHLENVCNFIACRYKEYGCQEVVLRIMVDEHTDSCIFTPKACRFCDQMKATCKVKKHQKNCKRKQVVCPNKCKAGKLHPSKIENHLKEDCPLAIIACEYRQYDCTHECKRRDMAEHVEQAKDNHQLLRNVTRRLDEMKTAFDEENKAMKRKIFELEGRLGDNENSNPRRRHRSGRESNGDHDDD